MSVPFPQSRLIKIIEETGISTRKEREQWIEEVDFNLYNLKSSQIMVDLWPGSGENHSIRKNKAKTLKNSRISAKYLGDKLTEYGIPIVQPITDNEVLLEVRKILPQIAEEQNPAYVLAIEIYKEGGIRTGNEMYFVINEEPVQLENELLSLKISPKYHTKSQLDYVASVIRNVYECRDELTVGYEILSDFGEGEPKISQLKFRKAESDTKLMGKQSQNPNFAD